MSMPGILTGNNSSDNPTIFRDTRNREGGQRSPSSQGVFARNPGSTAKTARNRGGRANAEHRESMARLFIEMPGAAMEDFLDSVSPETRRLAQVLAVSTDSHGTGGMGFMDFLLTRAQESFVEKAQIVDTLTDTYVAYYSGQAPPVFQYSGTLLNTYQDDQRVWMLKLYREVLRGTRLAGRGLIARLRYDSFIVAGYLESLSLGLQGATEHTASEFMFSMRVKRLHVITPTLSMPVRARTRVSVNHSTGGDETAGEGAVTPEKPSASSSNLAASQADRVQGTVQQLMLTGMTELESRETVASVIADNVADEAGSGVDPREEDAESDNGGHERVAATTVVLEPLTMSLEPDPMVISLEPATPAQPEPAVTVDGNPDNVANDGRGGRTNVYGEAVAPDLFDREPDDIFSGREWLNEPLESMSGARRRGGLQ